MRCGAVVADKRVVEAPAERQEREGRQEMTQKLLLMAAGGTGGHMFPAQALAEAMLRKGKGSCERRCNVHDEMNAHHLQPDGSNAHRSVGCSRRCKEGARRVWCCVKWGFGTC